MIIFTEVHLPRQDRFTYPREEIERAVIDYSDRRIKNNSAIGCFPPDLFGEVNLINASHAVKSLKLLPDGMIYGEFETLETEGGRRIIASMILRHKWVISCFGAPDENGDISGLKINTIHLHLTQ